MEPLSVKGMKEVCYVNENDHALVERGHFHFLKSI